MKTLPPTTELHLFRDFLNAKLTNGGADMSPEEALDEFREEHDPLDDEDDVAAIQAELDDLKNGVPCIPADQVIQELCAEFNLPDPRKQ